MPPKRQGRAMITAFIDHETRRDRDMRSTESGRSFSMSHRSGKFGLRTIAALTASIVLGTSAWADHCNSYRGPAGQVPPSNRTPNDPTPPASGGGGATTPGSGGATTGPTTPGPVTGG